MMRSHPTRVRGLKARKKIFEASVIASHPTRVRVESKERVMDVHIPTLHPPYLVREIREIIEFLPNVI